MATSTNKKTADDNPFDGTLAAFVKEAEKEKSGVVSYKLAIDEKGTRVTFKGPDEIGTAEYMTVFGGGLNAMTDEAAAAFFLNTMLSKEHLEKYLEVNPPLMVTLKVIEAVNDHYEGQVATPGESSASSD